MGARRKASKRVGELVPDVPAQRKRKSDASADTATAAKRARVRLHPGWEQPDVNLAPGWQWARLGPPRAS